MNDDHRRLSPYVRDEEALQRGIEQTALAQTRAAMTTPDANVIEFDKYQPSTAPAPEWLQSLLREKYPAPPPRSGPVLEIVTQDGTRHTLPSRPDSETEQLPPVPLAEGKFDLSGVLEIDWNALEGFVEALEAWFRAVPAIRHAVRLNRRALQNSHERRLVKARRKLRRSLWTGKRRG